MLSQDQNSPRKNEISDQTQRFRLTIKIKVAFWWPYYVDSLMLFCKIFGTTLCPLKFDLMAKKAVKVTVVKRRKIKG